MLKIDCLSFKRAGRLAGITTDPLAFTARVAAMDGLLCACMLVPPLVLALLRAAGF